MTIFELLDYIGTAVFAISGALAGMRKKLDPFGVLILASVTAIGGGTLRDMLIGRTPVGWMENYNYLYLIIFSTLISIVFRKKLSYFRRTIFLFDSIGLGLFTITGVKLGLQFGLSPVVCVLIGTMSASFGGVIRDVLSNEIPLIFRQDIYAIPCIVGGALFLILNHYGISETLNSIITSSLVFIIRVLATQFHWHLPKFYLEENES